MWLEPLGVPEEGLRFYDAHVAADEVHQDVALYDLVGGFLKEEPGQRPEVLFGARAVTLLEQMFAEGLARAWRRGGSSLRPSET
jgi:Iron-containing redox enzyme